LQDLPLTQPRLKKSLVLSRYSCLERFDEPANTETGIHNQVFLDRKGLKRGLKLISNIESDPALSPLRT
jgi:hypothetical protein